MNTEKVLKDLQALDSIVKDSNTPEDAKIRAKQAILKIKDQYTRYNQQSGEVVSEPQKTFLESVKEDFQKRIDNLSGTYSMLDERGNTDPLTTARNVATGTVQTFGQPLGFPLDVIGEGLERAPEEVKAVGGAISEGAKWVNEKLGDPWSFVKEYTWDKLPKESQENLTAGANILTFGTPSPHLGLKVMSAAEASGKAIKRKRIADYFIEPKIDTPAGREAHFKRQFEDTVEHAKMADALSEIKGISPHKSLEANGKVLFKELENTAEKLKKDLDKSDVRYNRDTLDAALQADLDRLRNSETFMRSDASIQNAFNIAVKGMQESLRKHGNSPKGLLQARQTFDRILSNKMFKHTLEDKDHVPLEFAAGHIRRRINELIDELVPLAGVKESLAKQTNIYRGIDSLAYQYGREKSLMGTITGYAKSHPFLIGSALQGAGMVKQAATSPLVLGAAAIGAPLYAGRRFGPDVLETGGRLGKVPAGIFDIGGQAAGLGAFYMDEEQ